ncbi:MAG: hypothetical protein AB1601_07160 [Planctomycetota bacterium]
MHRITPRHRTCEPCPIRSPVGTHRCAVRRGSATDLPGPRATNLVGLTVTDALAQLDCPGLQEIRRQIADGTYLTPDKLNFVYQRLLTILNRVSEENERVTA